MYWSYPEKAMDKRWRRRHEGQEEDEDDEEEEEEDKKKAVKDKKNLHVS